MLFKQLFSMQAYNALDKLVMDISFCLRRHYDVVRHGIDVTGFRVGSSRFGRTIVLLLSVLF